MTDKDIPSELDATDASKLQIANWVKKIGTTDPYAGPIADPDYSEFWIELKRKNEDVKLADAYIQEGPLSDLMKAQKNPDLIKPISISEYLKSTKAPLDKLEGWGEDAFTEITAGPEGYAEMFPHIDDVEKPNNSVVTFYGKNKGSLVSESHYAELFKAIKNKGNI